MVKSYLINKADLVDNKNLSGDKWVKKGIFKVKVN